MNGTDNLNHTLATRFAQEQCHIKEQEEYLAQKNTAHFRSIREKEKRQEKEVAENLEWMDRLEDEVNWILLKGKPYQYILNTFSLDHVGDLTAARCMTLTFVSSAVANGDGLHCYISGNSGKGKSHAAERMFSLLPKEYCYNRTFSDKYLFYKGKEGDLRTGIVLLIDDQTMSASVQELFKVAVSKFSKGTVYGTVYNQRPLELELPPRISWVLLKVDDPGDEQVMNRLIQVRIDESDQKIRDSSRRIQEKYHNLQKKKVQEERWEVQVCRRLFQRIKDEMVAVEVPCVGHVKFSDFHNLRNHEIFFNLLMSHALIHRWQRPEIGKTEDGIPIIRASEVDFKEADYIFSALHAQGGQRHNTIRSEDEVIRALVELNPPNGLFTIKDLVQKTGFDHNKCRRSLKGRKGTTGDIVGGLLSKCPYIQKLGNRGRQKIEMESQADRYSETIRRESFHEEIYHVDVPALESWVSTPSRVVWLEGFRWP